MVSNRGADSHLSGSQTLLWAGQMIYPDVPLYNMILTFRIDGHINTERFRKAVLAVASRCDALHTVFEQSDGIPSRHVVDPSDEIHSYFDLSTEDDPEWAVEQWIDERRRRVFELNHPPTDSSLLKLSDSHFIWYLNQHHLITDGWSSSLVFRLTAEAYENLASSDQITAHAPEPSYGEYVRFQEEFISSRRGDSARKYWQNKLESVPPPVNFYGRPLSETPRTLRVKIPLGHERTRSLRAVAASPDARALNEDISIFNLLATALLAFLHRASGNDRIALGAPAHCRMTPDQKRTVGVFIEVLPLMVQVDSNDTFGSLLTKVAQESGQHLRYALPASGSGRLSRSFNVLLNYINVSFESFAGLRVKTDWVHTGYGDAAHHLRLQVHDFDASRSLQLHFDFNEEVFDEELRSRAIADFLETIDDLLQDLQNPIRTSRDAEQVSSTQHSSKTATVDCTNVVEEFDLQAFATPDAIAVSGNAGTLTYAQVRQKSQTVAQNLVNQGISSGHRVGVFMRRQVDLIPAVLGILRSGAAYIPVDASDPMERVSYVLQDAAVSAVVTESNLLDGVPASFRPSALVVDALDYETDVDELRQSHAIESHDTAYIIYTSGSTGRPKGVVVSHGALFRYLSWAVKEYANGEPTQFPLFTSISFDLSVTSLFVPLLCGGRVRVYTEDAVLDASILDVIGDDAVDCIKMTPSHAAMLSGMSSTARRVRSVIFGGEDLRRDVAELARTVFGPNVIIYNEYGPTEATVGCAIHRYSPALAEATSVPIGLAVPHATVQLLDSNMAPVARGQEGEIFIAGSALADGYWRRPDLTKERFVESPLVPGERMYRTGDLARADEAGCMTYLGRIDGQIKVRGFRVERAEVEAALLAHPGIESAVVHLTGGSSRAPADVVHCIRCGLSSRYPGVTFNKDGLCNTCEAFDSYRANAMEYFGTTTDLQSIFNDALSGRSTADYDCLVLLSGGKDSSYVLYQIVELGLRPLAFTLDNGFISDGAKANIARICDDLRVDHVYGRTAAMNEIFVDSLKRHANVCNGCFKTIYTLAAKEAVSRSIPIVVTGLSRGQLFETRLSGELFSGKAFDVQTIDELVLDARKAYHRLDDAVSQLLDVEIFQDDDVFQSVTFIDFYRYCDVELDEMLEFLSERAPWIRPSDTGRSTNCLINEAGIFVHKKARGYHNYEWPYSWDVRMGHKERQAALDELDDQIDESVVREKLEAIGFEESQLELDTPKFCAYYTGAELIPPSELRDFLRATLPDYMIPQHFMRLTTLPLAVSGKVDLGALPLPSVAHERDLVPKDEPAGPVEIAIASVWSDVLRLDAVGASENFFDLGGDSILAIQISARAQQSGFRIPPNSLFRYQTVRTLAEWLASQGLHSRPAESAAEEIEADPDRPGSRTVRPKLSHLDETSLSKLAKLVEQIDQAEESDRR